jgi:hypothetical protein
MLLTNILHQKGEVNSRYKSQQRSVTFTETVAKALFVFFNDSF